MVTLMQAPPRDEDEGIGLKPEDLATLQEIERRILWLSRSREHKTLSI